jgi:hypothetical protein
MDEKEMSLVLCQAPEVPCGLVRDNPNDDFGRPLNNIFLMLSPQARLRWSNTNEWRYTKNIYHQLRKFHINSSVALFLLPHLCWFHFCLKVYYIFNKGEVEKKSMI